MLYNASFNWKYNSFAEFQNYTVYILQLIPRGCLKLAELDIVNGPRKVGRQQTWSLRHGIREGMCWGGSAPLETGRLWHQCKLLPVSGGPTCNSEQAGQPFLPAARLACCTNSDCGALQESQARYLFPQACRSNHGEQAISGSLNPTHAKMHPWSSEYTGSEVSQGLSLIYTQSQPGLATL